MSKLTRFTQYLFGSGAGSNEMAEFGSLAAASPTRYSGATVTPALIQALHASNFGTGWFGAVIGGNSPAIEDMNALCYLFAYQIAYIMQEGISEYDSLTTYYIGSYVNVSGILYRSKIDNNTGNTPSSNPSDWEQVANGLSPTVQKFTSSTGTYSTPAGVKYIRVRMAGGGGGGEGSGSGSQTAGGDGADTTFGSSFLTASGGIGGGKSGDANGGPGGAATIVGLTGVVIAGGHGSGRSAPGNATSPTSPGGAGGNNAFGGGGGGSSNTTGNSASANSGGGGGGAGVINSSTTAGAGGGAGGFIDVIIPLPSSTYAYAIGSAGSAGGAGTSGSGGGVGAAGVIIVEEFYQ